MERKHIVLTSAERNELEQFTKTRGTQRQIGQPGKNHSCP